MNPTFTCSRCGKEHAGPPMAYSSVAPGRWYRLSEDELELSRLDGEMCAVETEDGREFFVKANVEIPVTDGEDPLVFSAWVQLGATHMARMIERWEHPDRGTDPAYVGALANDLPGYPETAGLTAEVQTGAPGDRSRAVITPSAHPLADDQWQGIKMSRVVEIAQLLAHPLR